MSARRKQRVVFCATLLVLACGASATFSATNNSPARQLPLTPPPQLEPPFARDVAAEVGGVASRLGRDYWTQFTSPVRFARQHPKRFLLSATGLVALILTDHRTFDILAPREGLEKHNLVEPARKLSEWGNTTSSFPLVLALGAIGVVARSERERDTSVMLAEALLTSGTWTAVAKLLSGRERPREREEKVSDWEGPSFLSDERSDGRGLRSFPSGHSTGAWAVATVLANQYPKYGIVPVLAYTGAAAMSYSRMILNAHWLTDVLVGGLIGYGSAKQVISSHRSRPAADPANLGLGIDVFGGYKGISLRYDF